MDGNANCGSSKWRWPSAETRNAGSTIYIRGEAGIGKTRLLEKFQAKAEGANFAAHSGLVLDFGLGSGQDAIRSVVRSLLGLSSESSQEEIEAAAEKAFEDGMLADERRVYLNDLLNVPQSTELRTLYDAMDNAARDRGKRATVAELVTHASGRRPRLLAIEDLHWADQTTLDHLANLTETVAGCPALLVMTSRIERDPLDEAWRSKIAGQPIVTIDLGPLQPSEADRLAESYFDALGELAQRCIERAAGNPLFLEQLLRHAEESAEGGVPGSIRSLVQARLDRLASPDKQALQAASVLGQRFTAEALGSPARPARVELRRTGAASPGAPAGRSLPLRPRADPGGRLRYAAQKPAPRAAPAGGRLVQEPRPDVVRTASRSGGGCWRAASLSGSGARAGS